MTGVKKNALVQIVNTYSLLQSSERYKQKLCEGMLLELFIRRISVRYI